MKFRILFLLLSSLIFNSAVAQNREGGMRNFQKGEELWGKREFSKAIDYYEKSCLQGVSHGCRMVGFMYEYAKGVNKNYVIALDFYEKGCRLGNGLACGGVGLFHYHGYATGEPNHKKSKAYFKKGCDLGNDWSCDWFKSFK